MKLFTSLAVIALSLGEREEGQSLASEIVALALLVFALLWRTVSVQDDDLMTAGLERRLRQCAGNVTRGLTRRG